MTIDEFDKKITVLREPLYKFILTKCKFNEPLAEDIVQITLIKAFKFLSKNEIRSDTFKSWLFTIATNNLMSYYRQKEDKNLFYEDFAIADHNNDILECFDKFCDNNFENNLVDKMILEDIISNGFEELKVNKPDTFEILMDAIEGKDYNSISIERNIPENTVKTRVFRARKFLQKYMETKNLSLDMVSQ